MKAAVMALVCAVSLFDRAAAQTSPSPTFVDVAARGVPLGMGWVTITVDKHGNRYVTDRWRYWVRKITPAGEVTTLAGDPVQSGARDGNGANARFSAPANFLPLAADVHGELFVADTYNNIIRKISVDGDVTTIAGQAGIFAHVDGIARDARFWFPTSIALDFSGTLYIADRGTIRTLGPDGVVRTLAGDSSPPFENVDGAGSEARLHRVAGIAVDRDRNVYVAGYDDTVRKVSPGGVVTTLAGRANERGANDGSGAQARFYLSGNYDFDETIPAGVAVDAAGNIWLTDTGNLVIRRITPAGVVTTHGREARFIQPTGIAVDDAGNLHVVDRGVADRILVAKGEQPPPFALHATPQSQTVVRGGTAVFSVAASGAGLTYQWNKDGIVLAQATTATLVITGTLGTDAGTYGWSVHGPQGVEASGEAVLLVDTTAVASRITNASVRSDVVSPATTLIVGTTIAGGSANETLPVLIRALGPSLGALGIQRPVSDPTLSLLRVGSVIATNDNWGGDRQIAARTAEVGAFPFESPTSRDAAIATSLLPGPYVMEIGARSDGAGTVLAELFAARQDAGRAESATRIVNLSALKALAANGETLTVGFVIAGSTARTVLIRAVGPSLAAFGISAGLADPTLQLFAGRTLLRETRAWAGEEAITQVGRSLNAFALSSIYSQDAALLITLAPGDYTVQARSQSGAAGLVLAEIFEGP